MKPITKDHITNLASQIRDLVEANSDGLIRCYQANTTKTPAPNFEIKLSIAASITKIGDGCFKFNVKLRSPVAIVNDANTNYVDENQLGLFEHIENMRPKKGSRIDSIEISAPGRNPVKLEVK